ncbi:MAG: SDR family oxidoreductase [Firmicutes bacterium]|nr:SDR family oxidoreductase [Bacillota bacterium]MCD7746995.1 SDR family oxidoreductase [Bacillota bacterium]MCD7788484.1 SDR family oxidoreductase [Bacillota bacterium]MCD8314112.1 SDR family oxidoreductase [Bacillota bacterium]
MKTAIITGGSRGIGEAMTLKLGEMGYNVVINYRSESSKALTEKLVATLGEKYGVEGYAVRADVSKYEDCEALVKAAVEKFGEKIDVLVNNAGITNNSPFCELSHESYMAVIETNMLSAFHMCHFVVPYMVKANEGCVISTSSIGGLMGVANQADYCASKSGLIGMTRALAMEFGKQNIRFNCICPGMIWTDMLRGVNQDEVAALAQSIPAGKIGDVDDIANAMEFLIKDKYMTGQYVSPNGGIYMP